LLQEFRMNRYLSTEQAAREIGVSASYLRQVLAGKASGKVNGVSIVGAVGKAGKHWIWSVDLVEKIKKARG